MSLKVEQCYSLVVIEFGFLGWGRGRLRSSHSIQSSRGPRGSRSALSLELRKDIICTGRDECGVSDQVIDDHMGWIRERKRTHKNYLLFIAILSLYNIY